jgi:hypothetical protein
MRRYILRERYRATDVTTTDTFHAGSTSDAQFVAQFLANSLNREMVLTDQKSGVEVVVAPNVVEAAPGVSVFRKTDATGF